jgi:hypothetical protein
MPSSGLSGPFALTESNILTHIPPRLIGTYALGMTDKRSNTFLVDYVGRSDNDVAARLLGWVGIYKEFKFDYFLSAEAAFEKECHLYHDFNPPDNQLHPARPRNSKARCPHCLTEAPTFCDVLREGLHIS